MIDIRNTTGFNEYIYKNTRVGVTNDIIYVNVYKYIDKTIEKDTNKMIYWYNHRWRHHYLDATTDRYNVDNLTDAQPLQHMIDITIDKKSWILDKMNDISFVDIYAI